jgi:hypothetical protein
MAGFDECHRCRSKVQTLDQLDREHRKRLQRIEELESKLGAVES